MRTLIRLQRHADAEAAADTSFQADLRRQLSDTGLKQIENRNAEIGQSRYQLAIAGDSDRCRDTVARTAGIDPKDVQYLPALTYHDPATPDGAICEALYKKNGDAPLLRFLTQIGGHHILERSVEAWNLLARRITPLPFGDDGVRRVLVGCHGYYGTALAIAAVGNNYAATLALVIHPVGKTDCFDLWFDANDQFDSFMIRA